MSANYRICLFQAGFVKNRDDRVWHYSYFFFQSSKVTLCLMYRWSRFRIQYTQFLAVLSACRRTALTKKHSLKQLCTKKNIGFVAVRFANCAYASHHHLKQSARFFSRECLKKLSYGRNSGYFPWKSVFFSWWYLKKKTSK